MKGHWVLKRVIEVAAAGRHNLFLFGPPGSGKTMAPRRLPSIMSPLTKEESLKVTQIHSLAGMLENTEGLIRYTPFRMPHHSASTEGIIGGGLVSGIIPINSHCQSMRLWQPWEKTKGLFLLTSRSLSILETPGKCTFG